MANEFHSGNDNQPGVPFALKAIVIGLGIAIIIMLLLLVAKVLMKKKDEPYSGGSTQAIVATGGVLQIPLDLGPDARVRETAMERGILTLVVETQGGDKVVLFDVKEGRVLSVLDLSAQAPKVPE